MKTLQSTAISVRVRGFTIVELLIVIVVIAILAAISVVAFNGVQDRTYATKAASAIDGFVKTLEMYRTDHGEYPAAESSAYACVGTVQAYSETADFDEGVCSSYGDQVDESLNQKLKSYVTNIPDGSLPTIDGGDGLARGIIYVSYGQSATLYYFVNGDQPCPRGEKMSWREGTTACMVSLTGTESGSGSGSGSI